MSEENCIKSNSQSESSSSSPTPSPFFQEHFAKDQQHDGDLNDLTLFGSKAPTITRSGTVKRVRSVTLRKEMSLGYSSSTISEVNIASARSERASLSEQSNKSKFRRSLDSTFRRSLESISENKPKRSFSPTFPLSNNSSKYSSSLESISSDQTDYAMRSETTEAKDARTIPSPATSYLSWMESINSAYFSNTNSNNGPHSNADEIDCKVGEWNNFWLNYSNSNARKRYLSSPYPSGDEKFSQMDDTSEAQSSISTTQKEQNRNPTEFVSLTHEELQETIKCSTRITEIMRNALSRNEYNCENNMENAAPSETHSSRNNSSLTEEQINVLREDMMNVSRERSYSYIINTQELIKQKQSLKPSIQSSSTNCINALLNTGVADILKKVINRRRDVMTPDDLSSMTRRSYSEWSNK